MRASAFSIWSTMLVSVCHIILWPEMSDFTSFLLYVFTHTFCAFSFTIISYFLSSCSQGYCFANLHIQCSFLNQLSVYVGFRMTVMFDIYVFKLVTSLVVFLHNDIYDDQWKRVELRLIRYHSKRCRKMFLEISPWVIKFTFLFFLQRATSHFALS